MVNNKLTRCKECGEYFTKTSPNSKYCCTECKNIARRKQNRIGRCKHYHEHKPVKYCRWCGEIIPDDSRYYKYCSDECKINSTREQSRKSSIVYYHKYKRLMGEYRRGLGSMNAFLGCSPRDSFDDETAAIINEKRRLGL